MVGLAILLLCAALALGAPLLIAARDLGLIDNSKELWPKVEAVSKMLRSLTDAVLSGGSTAREGPSR